MKSYHFDLGDSTRGPIGFCARVRAGTKLKAVEILRAALPESVRVPTDSPHMEYIEVYLNPEFVDTRHIDAEIEDAQ